jgi:putative phosphoribosyl transferase
VRRGMDYRNRSAAGRELAMKLLAYKGRQDVLVLALPRGGVPVAYQVAKVLRAPLDIWVVRKLGVPGHEELAMGAIASGGTLVVNDDILWTFGVSKSALRKLVEKEQVELARRERIYRGERPPLPVKGRTVIVVDDGLATGSTMRAAVSALRQKEPGRIVVAVPVASLEACASLHESVDETVCAQTPQPFYSVSQWYQDFTQITDQEVRVLLDSAAALSSGQALGEARPG